MIAAGTDTVYALVASLAAPRLVRASGSPARFAIGGAYFGLGLFAVLSGNRANP
ncbi:MAG TPA: hypothetical protein VIN61_14620 [Gammaproteobacteria bacterium]